MEIDKNGGPSSRLRLSLQSVGQPPGGFFAEIQAKACGFLIGTAIVARKSLFKYARQILRRDADSGVRYFQDLLRRHGDGNGSFPGIFDAVGQNLLQDKEQPFLIRKHPNLCGFVGKLQFLTDKQNQCASFLLGAVLENDIAALRSSHALKIRPSMRVCIAGKEPLCSALLMLLKEADYFSDIQSVHLPDQCPMAGYGALLIAKERGDFYESNT